MVIEATIERYFVRQSKKHRVWAIKVWPIGNRGFPDRLCLAKEGRVFFVELKRPGGKPRKLQIHMAKKLEGLGFNVYTISTKEEVDVFYEAF